MICKIIRKILPILRLALTPAHWRIVFRDVFGYFNKISTDEAHLRATIRWLCEAQDATDSGAVAAGYDLKSGWRPEYPETTGYIICTFIQYAISSNDDQYVHRAIAMGDWEIEIQLPNGSVRGGVGLNDYPIIFNTGQVIFGWISLFEHTKNKKYLRAAEKAADWLIKNQDEDGKWTKHTYGSIPHAYHSRVAWALFRVFNYSNNLKYHLSATKNITWIISTMNAVGWSKYMSFDLETNPYTHCVAYTLRGLIESAEYIKDDDLKNKVINNVRISSECIMKKHINGNNQVQNKFHLPGTLNEYWESNDQYTCLTGNAQMAIVYLKLADLIGDNHYLNSARVLVDDIKKTQYINIKNKSINGGVAGSYPLWGKYDSFFYPNWSAKFFADVLMLKQGSVKN